MNNSSNIITISNHKGGVGKTTSSINIGAGLNKLGKKVLLIDLDPQANLSQSLGISEKENNIYSAMRGRNKAQPIEIIQGFELIPSTLDLSAAEIELSSEAGREYILSEILEPEKKNYDYIIVDSPPSLGLLTINAFVASDMILIPLQAEYLALQGLTKLVEIVEKIKRRLNKKLEIAGIVITRYDKRKVLNRDIVETVEVHFKNKIFKTKIRENISLAEAPIQKKDIFRYDEKCHGSEDYLSLCKELVNIK